MIEIHQIKTGIGMNSFDFKVLNCSLPRPFRQSSLINSGTWYIQSMMKQVAYQLERYSKSPFARCCVLNETGISCFNLS